MSMASSSKTQPASYGGWGKQIGPNEDRETAKKTKFGLKDKSFLTDAFPDIPERARILGVCGVPEADSSPADDGWFFSDFFLFHHLLYDTNVRQKWLACVHPLRLLKKYGEYVHGDPRTPDRKVVLDGGLALQFHDLRVVQPRDFVSEFLRELQTERNLAVQEDCPLIIFIFAHGFRDPHMVSLGGIGSKDYGPECTKLKLSDVSGVLRSGIRGKLDVTFVSTACFSGGWVVLPDILNTTHISATTDDEMSLSWPVSASVGRYCGGRFASAITKSLMRLTVPALDPVPDADIHGTVKRSDFDESVEPLRSYAGLMEDVRATVESIDNRPCNDFWFSAQNDSWEQNWAKRTGLPLVRYQERWNELKSVPKGDYLQLGSLSSASKTGTIRLGGRWYDFSAGKRQIQKLAQIYLTSKPGESCIARNQIMFRRALNAAYALAEDEDPEWLCDALMYRIYDVMAKATAYKNFLQFDFPDCEELDPWEYEQNVAREDKDRAREISVMGGVVSKFELIQSPDGNQGQDYWKGDRYLACAFEREGYDRNSMLEKLRILATQKDNISRSAMAVKQLQLNQFGSLRHKINVVVQETGKKLKELSPRKRKGRKSISELFTDIKLGPEHIEHAQHGESSHNA